MSPHNEPVGIIGSGSWGTAIAQLSADAGHKVLLWTRSAENADSLNSSHINKKYWPDHRLSENISSTSNLEEVASFAKLIIVVAPSHGFRGVVSTLGAHLAGDHILIHATKGIELDTLKRMSEVLREETPAKRIGVLSGPNLSAEIMNGMPAATVVASKFPEVVERAQAALTSQRFRVYGSKDMTGVEIAGALKNIVAICAGVISGLELGTNAMSMLITRGAVEIQRFGMAMGADAETFSGLSGIGDIIATCMSVLSRNHQVGLRLSRGEKLDDILSSMNRVAEGVRTVGAVHEMSRRMKVEMPITWGVYAMLNEGADPQEICSKLMSRQSKYEVE